MSDKLKLCPFCGSDDISSGEAMLEHEHEPNVIYKQTGCLSCGAFGSETKEDDIYGTKCDDAWNKRTESEHKIKVLIDALEILIGNKTSEGYLTEIDDMSYLMMADHDYRKISTYISYAKRDVQKALKDAK